MKIFKEKANPGQIFKEYQRGEDNFGREAALDGSIRAQYSRGNQSGEELREKGKCGGPVGVA